MPFNKHYVDDVLKRVYGFMVERDATGLAFNSFLEQGDNIVHLSGPWGDKEAARQTGIVNLISKIESREVARLDALELTVPCPNCGNEERNVRTNLLTCECPSPK